VRSVAVLGGGRVEVTDRPEPVPGPGQVVVRVMASALCGSERHGYEGAARAVPAGATAGNGGHEAAGVVEAAGERSAVAPGDRVLVFSAGHCGRCRYCRQGRWILCQHKPAGGTGTHAELIVVGEDRCIPIPADLPFEDAALLADAFGTPYHALRRLRVAPADTVLVVGQGPVGMAAAILAGLAGAAVVVADVDERRLRRASTLGAVVTVNPRHGDVGEAVRSVAGPDGAEVALECSASPAGAAACLAAVAPGGRIAFIGLNREVAIDVTPQLILRDLTVIGSWYSDPADVTALIRLCGRGLEPGRLITHRFGIEDAPLAFTTFFAGGDAAKVMLEPGMGRSLLPTGAGSSVASGP
jgi:2-desacetyl-2-hydroxyethyl bacteriochlorophyllide A dehydrogenase